MVKVFTRRKRGRPSTRVQRVVVKSGGTQIKAEFIRAKVTTKK